MAVIDSVLARDVRYAVRGLRKAPAFAAGAVATIALAVGATTAIFSVVYAVLVRQLPYARPQQVFWIWSDQPGRDRAPFNVPDFIDYRDSTTSLSGLAGYFSFGANLSDEGAAERLQGIRATGNFFDVLGAHAQSGRLLTSGDERPGEDHVVVLSYETWTRRFGGDSNVIGTPIRLSGENYTVVGVARPGFVLPVRDVDFVVPFAPDRDPRRGARNSLNFILLVGRLAPDASPEAAASELTAIATRLRREYPVENAQKRGVRFVSLAEGLVGSFRTALLAIFGAVATLLLIACANLANLMLARATARRRSAALQLAMGASRFALGRQVLTEAFVLSACGGALGVVIARSGVAGLRALAPVDLPRAGEIQVDAHVLAFSLLVSVVTAVVFGIVPAVATATVDAGEALQASTRTTPAAGWRGALVGAEVASAVVLLTAMALLGRSFANVQAVDAGFASSQVLTARLSLPAARYTSRESIVKFQRALRMQVEAMPGVVGTGAVSILPMSGLRSRVPFTVDGRPVEPGEVPFAQYRTASAGYFEAMGIPLERGRTFTAADTDATRPVAVVNRTLATRWLAGRDPIGSRLFVDDNDGAPRPIEVVGVVGDVRQHALDEPPTADLYIAYPQIHPDNVGAMVGNMFWVIRTAGEPGRLAEAVVRDVRAVDADVAAAQVRPAADYLSASIGARRFSLSLIAAFAAAALLLTATGIYAVTTYAVSQRGREIGIRIALGASRSAIARLIAAAGVRPVLGGIAVGCGLAVAAARSVSSMLFDVAPADPAVIGQVVIAVAAVAGAACAIPVLRAGRLPADVLQRD